MIDMSEVIHSPEFQRDITIERTTGGQFIKSVYTPSTPYRFTLQGVLNPDTIKSVTPSPEGSRATGQLSAYFSDDVQIYTTHDLADGNDTADKIIWDAGTPWESSYRIISVNSEYGLKKVVAERVGAI